MKRLATYCLLLTLSSAIFAQQTAIVDGKTVILNPDGTWTAGEATAKAKIHVYRYKQFSGKALNPSVFCDGTQVAKMDNGRYFTMELDPGKHSFSSNDKQSEIVLDLKPGATYYIRVDIAAGFFKGHGRLTLMQPEQGAPEVAKLQYLSPGDVKDSRVVLTSPNAR